MARPSSLWEQFAGKVRAEVARGEGVWPLQPHPCNLEPPWDSFDLHELTIWDAAYNGWSIPWEGRWWKRAFFPPHPLLEEGERVVLPEEAVPDPADLSRIVVEQFPDDESTIGKADVFLRSLVNVTHPVAFEILGMGAQPQFDHEKVCQFLSDHPIDQLNMNDMVCGWSDPYVKTQFVAHQSDARQVQNQLLAQYPNSAVLEKTDESELEDSEISGDIGNAEGYGSSLSLRHPYCQSIRVFTKLDPDPLGVILAAMDHLERDEWALVQILFRRAAEPWGESLQSALRNPFSGKSWFDDISDRMLHDKFSTPLFAVTVRIAARTRETYHHLIGWAEQFASPPQGFAHTPDDDDADTASHAIPCRCTYRPGMLLNAAELASLVHLPGESVISERLKRVKMRTRRAPLVSNPNSAILLGENLHRGIKNSAYIPPELRHQHCYVCGASGTGKSTLLLNMILQDINAGRGVGVLDPHGDLIHDVLQRIPEERVSDVILFDPADDQFPFALNILEITDETERERIVAETVMSLERYFPDSWGPRLERILTFTLYTVLDAIPGATLADVERMLTDSKFREDVILKTKDSQFVDFWNRQFAFMPKNAVDPVLNKLSVFLLNKTVRNIVCQRHSAIDFDSVLNDGKILLANLSTGRLSEKIAGTLGSFLVTKIVNAAFRRANIPEEERRPWYLYVDEFQSFMNLSMGFERILVGARKFKLILAGLANQYVSQISPSVRQALAGNVETTIAFKLGVSDANTISSELGVFGPDEILNLEVGQAIVRSGSASKAFNIQTFPKPVPPDNDPTSRIQESTRIRYARPRKIVEAELGVVDRNETFRQFDQADIVEPSDPNEDDFIK